MRTNAFELIAKPNADLVRLCGLAYMATDRKISDAADKHMPPLPYDRKLAACFNTFIEHDPLTLGPLVSSHMWFSGFMVVEEYLVPEVMMHASELACLSTSTKTRGLSAMILSGNLNGWRGAIEAGQSSNSEQFDIWTLVRKTFVAAGYDSALKGLPL